MIADFTLTERASINERPQRREIKEESRIFARPVAPRMAVRI